ncbi:hypothetical protein Efla_006821 [Eimeria flavescens]
MGAEELPSRGKLLHQHKAELRVLKTEAKKALAKAKSKEEKSAAETKYAELEQQLLQRQQQQLLALSAAAAEDTDVSTPEAEAVAAAAEAAARRLTEPANESADAEKATLESLEALTLYRTDRDGRKPSKAQRRRDKKQQQLREKEQLFERARAESNAAEVEWSHLEDALREEGFTIFSVPGDGDCLFRHEGAIVHQLKASEGPEAEWDVRALRSKIADLLLQQRDTFKPFLDAEQQQEGEYEAFCENIRCSQDWGGEIELHAASELLQRPIRVFAFNDSVSTITYGEGFKGKPLLRLVFHRQLLATGPHYNSVLVRQ